MKPGIDFDEDSKVACSGLRKDADVTALGCDANDLNAACAGRAFVWGDTVLSLASWRVLATILTVDGRRQCASWMSYVDSGS